MKMLPPLLKDMVSDYSMRPIPQDAIHSHGHKVTILKLNPTPPSAEPPLTYFSYSTPRHSPSNTVSSSINHCTNVDEP